MMKRIFQFYIYTTALFLMFGCDPTQLEKTDFGTLADSTDVNFTIANGVDNFRFLFTNSSAVAGLAKWDFGNGTSADGNQVTGYFPLAGTYTITLTLYTKAGPVITTKEQITTKTDWSYFKDPDLIKLCGGADALSGKTWVMDSLSKGHIGVGAPGSDGLGYWQAGPLDKIGTDLYNDEINFTLANFLCTYINQGKSFVKAYRKDDANYTNPVDHGGDFTVNFTPAPGKWQLIKDGTKMYLTLTSSKPLFPCFDVGAVNGQYEILSLTDNVMELVAPGNDLAWHYKLITKGYVKPALKFDLTTPAGAGTNEFQFSLANIEIPTGWVISKLTWKFGDGMEQSETDINKAVVHTFMRKGPYNVTVEVATSVEPVIKSTIVNVEQNHPNYVTYLLDLMVMYQDFGEVSLAPMKFDNSDGSGSITAVANPDASKYPNLSSKVGLYSKTNASWANAYLQLPAGYHYVLTNKTSFRLLVYGEAGNVVLLKLENTGRGGDAWKTGAELRYTIQKTNTWEAVTYDFKGVSAGGNGDISTSDVSTDARFNTDFYDVIRIMYNPGDNSKPYSFYFDDLAGPHMEGL